MDERRIIERCQNNDIRAFQMIYERYGQALLHTAQRLLKRRQDAEDAVQVTFVKLYRGIHRYHFGAPFSTYLFRILINVCYDMLRKSKRAGEESLENREPSETTAFHEKMEIEHAVESLPPKMKACFVLFAV